MPVEVEIVEMLQKVAVKSIENDEKILNVVNMVIERVHLLEMRLIEIESKVTTKH